MPLAIGASIYYYKSEFHKLGLLKSIILVSLRSTTFIFLLSFLLSPLAKCKNTKEIKPRIHLIVDNSKSVLNNSDDVIRIGKVIENLKSTCSKADVDFSLSGLMPTDSILNRKYNRTNLNVALQTSLDELKNCNIKNVILVSDGNFNDGNSPLFVHNSDLVPISVILTGDTTVYPDLSIEDIDYNPVFLTNETNEISINIGTKHTNAKSAMLALSDLDRKIKLQTKQIELNSKAMSSSATITLDNLNKGQHRLKLEISSLLGERYLANNYKEIIVNVVDGKKTIYIAHSFPHPDISALKSILSSNKSFQIEHGSPSLYKNNADLLILYQLPNATDNGKNIIDKAKANGTSALYMLGLQSNYSALNSMNLGFKFSGMNSLPQDFKLDMNPMFSKFILKESTLSALKQFSPIQNTLGQVICDKEFAVHGYSLIGGLKTSQPLICFGQSGSQRFGVIAGENIWKWRLMDYRAQANINAVTDVFTNIVNYLSIVKDKRQLVVQTSSYMYDEADQVKIVANTYNEVYQSALADRIECKLLRQGSQWKSIPFVSQNGSYIATPNSLEEGIYQYKVSAFISGKHHETSGDFLIQKSDLESNLLSSNYTGMNTLTNKFGGNLFLETELPKLIQRIETSKYDSKLIEETKTISPLDIVLFLILILFLVCLEWLFRKYLGLY